MPNPSEGCQDSSDELSDGYNAGYEPLRLDFLQRRTFETHGSFLLPYLRPHHKVLDCGCGPGTISVGLARQVPQGSVICIDVSKHQLEEAQRCARDSGLANIYFVQQDVRALEFPSATFDVVFAHALMEHLVDPVAPFLEMWRVLRPGGVLALRSPNWTALHLSPPSDVARLCVEVFVSRLLSHRVLAESGWLTPLIQRLQPATIRRSSSTESHRPVNLFADVIIASLLANGGERLDTFSSMIDKFREWSRDLPSSATEKWDEIILVKDTTQ